LAEIWVYGIREADNVGFRFPPPPATQPLMDRTIASWVRKPLKIITSTQAKNVDDARQEAYEEILKAR
jgi:hypothetical protein